MKNDFFYCFIYFCGNVINWKEFFLKAVGPFFAAICAVLFRTRLGCFEDPPSQNAQEFITNCRKFFKTMQTLMYEPPYKKWFSSKTWDEFVECSDALLEQGKRLIESVPDDSLASHFLLNSKLKKEEVALTLLDLIIGAMETVSCNFGFLTAVYMPLQINKIHTWTYMHFTLPS